MIAVKHVRGFRRLPIGLHARILPHMAFEVRPEPVRTRFGLWPITVPIVVSVVLVGIALANPLPPSPPSPAPVVEATLVAAAPSSIVAVGSTEAAVVPPGRPIPSSPLAATPTPAWAIDAPSPYLEPAAMAAALRTLRCEGAIGHDDCLLVARSALMAIPGGLATVSAVSVWHSILCDTVRDCPPSAFSGGHVPLGSAVVAFADASPSAWINVTERAIDVRQPASRVAATAWIVRWQ